MTRVEPVQATPVKAAPKRTLSAPVKITQMFTSLRSSFHGRRSTDVALTEDETSEEDALPTPKISNASVGGSLSGLFQTKRPSLARMEEDEDINSLA